MKPSGTPVVLLIITVGLLVGVTTWWNYTTANPTTTDARLIHRDGDWFVEAHFPASEAANLKVDTGAIVTSTDFPGLRMIGLVSKSDPEGNVVISLGHGPPEDAPQQQSPAAVTLDAATAPQ